MRNKFLLKQSGAVAATTTTKESIHSYTNNMVNTWTNERTNVTHKPCNACIKSRRNYFFIIMFEFDTRHIVCVCMCVCVRAVLKLVNALFLWKLVRALKLKELLFCVDKFKYKTNYRCTLNDDPWARKQDKTRGRTKPNRKEKKRKKVERKTEDRLYGESGNTVAISSSTATAIMNMVHRHTQHWIHPVRKCCHFSKSYRTAYKHFPFHHITNSTCIRVLQTL